MNNVNVLLAVFSCLLFSSCMGKSDCAVPGIDCTFAGFDSTEMMTYTIRKYEKGSNYTRYVDSTSRQYSISPYYYYERYFRIDPDYDFEIVIYPITSVFRIKDIFFGTETQPSANNQYDRCNKSTSYRLNDSAHFHKGFLADAGIIRVSLNK